MPIVYSSNILTILYTFHETVCRFGSYENQGNQGEKRINQIDIRDTDMHQNDRTFSLYIGTMASNGMHEVKEQCLKLLFFISFSSIISITRTLKTLYLLLK